MAAAIPIYVAIAQGVAQSVAAKKQAAAQRTAAKLQTDAATHAADVGQQSNTDMIDFLKQQETDRRADADKTQALNFQQYQEDLARRQPYMNAGLGALTQMGQPRPNQMARPMAGGAPGAPYAPQVSQAPPPPGSLADLLAQQKGA